MIARIKMQRENDWCKGNSLICLCSI